MRFVVADQKFSQRFAVNMISQNDTNRQAFASLKQPGVWQITIKASALRIYRLEHGVIFDSKVNKKLSSFTLIGKSDRYTFH